MRMRYINYTTCFVFIIHDVDSLYIGIYLNELSRVCDMIHRHSLWNARSVRVHYIVKLNSRCFRLQMTKLWWFAKHIRHLNTIVTIQKNTACYFGHNVKRLNILDEPFDVSTTLSVAPLYQATALSIVCANQSLIIWQHLGWPDLINFLLSQSFFVYQIFVDKLQPWTKLLLNELRQRTMIVHDSLLLN